MKVDRNNSVPFRERKGELAITLFALLLMLALYSRFVAFVESRPGVVLDDPILRFLPSYDLTWPIFALVYGGVLLGLITLLRNPDSFLLAIRSYALILLVRIFTLYVTPFAAPDDMILLVDPIAGLGPGNVLQNDLFFSGHTATLFLLYLTARNRLLRLIFLGCTILIGTMLVVQHVHYSIDIIAALFFTWGCYSLAKVMPYEPSR